MKAARNGDPCGDRPDGVKPYSPASTASPPTVTDATAMQGTRGSRKGAVRGPVFDLPDGFSEYAAGDALPLLARRRDQHRQQGIILHGFGAGVQPGHFKRDGFRCGRRDQAYSHGWAAAPCWKNSTGLRIRQDAARAHEGEEPHLPLLGKRGIRKTVHGDAHGVADDVLGEIAEQHGLGRRRHCRDGLVDDIPIAKDARGFLHINAGKPQGSAVPVTSAS